MNRREQLLQHFLDKKKVSTDTRNIAMGAIFFALKGGNFDGNRYAEDALSKGASLAVVDDKNVANGESYFLVDDVLLALQHLSQDYRKTLDIPIIGITGTNGKTTTKELLYAILSSHFKCYATEGNLNNHIGVPLSLLKITSEHELAIIEMGANKPGDIEELCELSQPTSGLITNVGSAHLEGFGSFENVIKTKKELYDSLGNSNGLTFVNKDNEYLMKMANELSNLSYYSLEKRTPLMGGITTSDVRLRFKWKTPDFTSEEVITQLTGKYNLENAISAIAVAKHFEVPNDKIKSSLESYRPKNNRSQIKETARNMLILDAYNANITSTKAAVTNLAEIKDSSRGKFFILGDMLELGDDSKYAHEELMKLTSELGLNGVFVGEEYSKADEQAKYKCYSTTSELKENIEKLSLSNKLILIKGSRGIKLEVLEEDL